MSKITFSTKEIKTLQNNPNVQRVSEQLLHIQMLLKINLWMNIRKVNSLGEFL